jgi:ComF family protein
LVSHDATAPGIATSTACVRLLDLLYPPRCAACLVALEQDVPLCATCHTSLYPLGVACPRCAEPLDGAHALPCRRCRRAPPPFAAIEAPWRYGGELATALLRLKFGGRHDLARQLAPLYQDALRTAAIEVDLVVPVPLHWRRRLARGFDQAALLTARAGTLPAPVERRVLRRVRSTPAQTGRGAAERRRNLRGAFADPTRHRHRIAGRRVLLVDDVATTGATLAAAATALLAAGAAEVRGFAVARAESPAG